MKTNQLKTSWVAVFIRSNLALCMAVAMIGATGVVHAATLTWNNGSGNFIWDTSSLNWGGAAWTAGSDADFEATGAGTITVSGTIAVGTGGDTSLTINASGYTLTGGMLSFTNSSTGTSNTFLVNANAEIDTLLSDTNAKSTLNQTGTGTLTLNPGPTGTNTWGILKINTGSGLIVESGTLNLTGGSAGATAGGVQIPGGTLTLTGGTINSLAGTYNDSQGVGTLNITGGTYNFAGEFLNGYSTAGATLNLSGTGVLNVNALRPSNAANAPNAVVNLNGGTLMLNNFTAANDGGTVNFNGTTVQAKINTANFTAIPNKYTYNVLAGGAIYNTAGFNITNAMPLVHAAALGSIPDGGVTKLGAGLLWFAGTNTYTGPTTVTGGTLSIQTNSLAAGSVVTIGNNAALNLNFTGNDPVLAVVLGGVLMPAGTYNAGNASPYITGTGSLVSSFGGANASEIWTGAVNNNWDVTTMNWSLLGAAATWSNAPSPANAMFNAAGAGTVTLTQPINASSLLFAAPGYTIAGSTLTLGSTAAPNVAVAAAATISSTLSGSLACNDAATLTLSGANAFTGGVTNQAGILALANVNALQGATAGALNAGSLQANVFGTFANVPTFVLNGLGVDTFANYGALDFNTGGSGTVSWNGNLVLASNAAISSYGTGNTVNLNGVISGPGNLILAAGGSGNAVNVLNQQNTYLGTSQILNLGGLNNYTVQLGVANALPVATVVDISTVSNVAQTVSLDLNGHNQTVAGLTSTANNSTRSVENSVGSATLTINNSAVDVFAGVLGYSYTSFSLLKQGAGTLTITNANGYTGDTTVSAGWLVTSPNSTGNGTYEVAANATLETRIFSAASQISMSSLTLAGGSTNTITLLVPGNPGIAPINTGSLTVNGPATINLAGSQFTVGTFPLIAYGGGSVGGTGGFSALHLGTLPAGVSGQLVNTGTSVELQILALPQNLTWEGTINGVWDINGTSNWLNTDTSLNASYNESNNIGDNVTFDDSATGPTSITLNATVHPGAMIMNNDASVTYTISGNGDISGPVGLQILGGGTLILATDNDYSGVTTLSGGTLQIGNGGTVGSLGANTVNVLYSATDLAFNRTDAITVNNAIVNAGGNPNIDINSGTVTLGGNADNLGTVANVNAGGTLVLAKNSSPTVDAVDSLKVNTGGLVQLGGTGGNQILDSAIVTMNGGTFDLAGQNETVNAMRDFGVITNSGVTGTVTLTNASSMTAQNGVLTIAGGTISAQHINSIFGATFLQTGGTVGCNLFYDGQTAGAGYAAADFEGGTCTDSGAFVLGQNCSAQLTVGGSAVLSVNSFNIGEQSGLVYLNGGTLYIPYFNNAGTMSSSVYFNGTLVRGTLSTATFLKSATTTFYDSTNGVIIDSQAYALTLDQPLVTDPALGGAPDHGLLKLGAGSLTLAAANTYTGPTVVSNGTLIVNGVVGSGAVSVEAGATLVGSGIIGGPVTVNPEGILNVGGYGTNTLTINNTLTFMPGSTNVAIISSTNGTSDVVAGITAANYAGTLQVYDLVSPSAPTNGQTFQIFSAGSHTGNFTSITPAQSGQSWSFNPANGVLTFVSAVNTNPTNLTATVSSGNLVLNWPSDHTGWRLLVQTNNLNHGVSSNTNDWGTVSGSASTNQVMIPLNPTNPADFYRLVYP